MFCCRQSLEARDTPVIICILLKCTCTVVLDKYNNLRWRETTHKAVLHRTSSCLAMSLWPFLAATMAFGRNLLTVYNSLFFTVCERLSLETVYEFT